MGSVGSQLEELKSQLNNLRPYNNSKSLVQTPLIVDEAKTSEILRIRDELERKRKLPEPEVKSVFLDRLYTYQGYLEKDKLEKYVDKPIHELAEGIMYRGDVLVTDGNHRISLAKLNNQEMARMRIIDLDKKVRRRKK